MSPIYYSRSSLVALKAAVQLRNQTCKDRLDHNATTPHENHEHDETHLVITITKKSRTTQLNLLPTRKQRVNMWKESKDDNFKPESSLLRKSPMEKERATIGPSISIKGELSGEEDVVIQGRVEGKVSLDLQQDNASIASSLRRGKKARFLRLLEKNATPRVT